MKKSFWFLPFIFMSLAGCGQQERPAQPEHSVAPFIDTTRTATALGGTVEWSYMEGLAFDQKSRTIYYALSSIKNNMADGRGDINMPRNDCGGIFAAQLDAGWQSAKIVPILLGRPTADGRCADDAISNPDNLAVDGAGRLWIGEDASKKPNNMLWRYDPKTGELKRFASLPQGAEVAGLHITARGELFLNVQHPDGTNLAPFDKATVGVVEGFNVNSDSFSELPLPQGDAQRTLTLAGGHYNVLSRSGEQGAGVITNTDGSTQVCGNPDGNMPIPQADGSYLLYTNWECVPGGVQKQVLTRSSSGWKVQSAQMVDFMPVNGTWRNCNGTVSPWGTALSAEEDAVEADVNTWESWSEFGKMSAHLGRKASPYDYGYILELTPTATGTEVKKRYALGRTNFELAQVMPDRRTVYLTDDGNSRGVYRFVADRPNDLSSGTLYVARHTQVADSASANGQSLNVQWIRMGHGVESEIAAALQRLNPYK